MLADAASNDCPILWGTNRDGGPYYAGRVHIVWKADAHEQPWTTAQCGLLVQDVWRHRPPIPRRLCPDCCVRSMTRLFPTGPPAQEKPS